jgi:hypothetical protein
MAITVGATGTLYMNSGNVIRTPGLPAGVVSGDMLVYVTYQRETAGVFPTATGYSVVLDHATGNSHLKIEYKIAGAGEAAPSFATVTGASAQGAILSRGFALSGTDTVSPIDVTGTVFDSASSANIGPITGITPTVADYAVIVVGGRADDWTSVAPLTGDSLTWTETIDSFTTSGSDAGMVADVGIRSGAASAVTAKTFTVTGGTATPVKGVMFSVKPVVAAAEVIPDLAMQQFQGAY